MTFGRKMKKKRNAIFLLAILLLLLAIGCFCSSVNNDRVLTGEYHIAFTPDTIIQSLNSGKKNVFSLVSTDVSQEETNPYPYPVRWDQAEYLQIADAVHQYIWNESISKWRLKTVGFDLPCKYTNAGLQIANFTFSKARVSLDGISYIVHQIDIYPNRMLINAWEWVYKGYDGPLSLAPSIFMISAKDAVMIAERNGGLANLSSEEDACSISVIFSQGFASNRWDIWYAPSYFKISIDAKTGKIIK
jgi:hypothetical protein